MLAVQTAAAEDRTVLKRGDEFVFTKRLHLNAAVRVLRNGKPLTWSTPDGPKEAYSLGAKYERKLCESHAKEKAAQDGLSTGPSYEMEGELHVPVL